MSGGDKVNIGSIQSLPKEPSIQQTDTDKQQEGIEKKTKDMGKEKKALEVLRNTEKGSEESAKETSSIEIEKTVEDMNSFLNSMKKTLSFFVDKDSGRYGVKVVDNKTQKVIRQIPPQEVLEVAAKIKEMLGALLDKTI